LSFSVNRGQKVAIVGPSGAGKSTVLDLLLSLSTPDDGLICINGIPSQDFIESNPGFIGFVPQVTRIVNDSLVRNIALGVKPEVIDLARVSELVQALDLTGIQDVKTATARLGDDGGRLSGGQRQRIGIARALYSRPQILVLDEATSALDSISENKFSDFLESISSQITVLTVAHRLSTVKNSDVVLYLENGNLLGKGDFEEVRRKIPNFDEQARLMGL
jgi:ATP-binding cassette subfamily C protein